MMGGARPSHTSEVAPKSPSPPTNAHPARARARYSSRCRPGGVPRPLMEVRRSVRRGPRSRPPRNRARQAASTRSEKQPARAFPRSTATAQSCRHGSGIARGSALWSPHRERTDPRRAVRRSRQSMAHGFAPASWHPRYFRYRGMGGSPRLTAVRTSALTSDRSRHRTCCDIHAPRARLMATTTRATARCFAISTAGLTLRTRAKT